MTFLNFITSASIFCAKSIYSDARGMDGTARRKEGGKTEEVSARATYQFHLTRVREK